MKSFLKRENETLLSQPSSEKDKLRTVALFAFTPNIKAFGRRLLASGFHKIQRDVLAK